MPFKLTSEVVEAIFRPTSEGDWGPFIEAIDENVHWIINDGIYNSLTLSGTYNLQQWREKVGASLIAQRLEGPVRMKHKGFDIIGPKLILEASGTAMQKNGKPYNNTYCWIIVFSEETGKIITIREYMNSDLVRQVMETSI